ncbi:hypothetical protein T484DRAFT_2396736 [Baffinella frigidus]|nr:hypothetical protein T484DRAFT_2396736 [Cryptophyta sp. CCMP2293]
MQRTALNAAAQGVRAVRTLASGGSSVAGTSPCAAGRSGNALPGGRQWPRALCAPSDSFKGDPVAPSLPDLYAGGEEAMMHDARGSSDMAGVRAEVARVMENPEVSER